ncbi:Peptidase M20 [Forsythia ovata]|uniref:Peptidase M20 n=1 Tax=Forsythia ovata TaxID=205694 RepID=A0ABD1TAS3_9LAMI
MAQVFGVRLEIRSAVYWRFLFTLALGWSCSNACLFCSVCLQHAMKLLSTAIGPSASYHPTKVSDAHGFLERTFESPASVRAGHLIRAWMEDAGLRTWVDQMGNVHGRIEGMNASEKALLIGSHLVKQL